MSKEKISVEAVSDKKKNSKETEICVCTQCGYETIKKSSVPCSVITCPICDKSLVCK
jgi:rubrerythrin